MIVVDASVLANALADDHADGDAARGELRADVSAYDDCYVALTERLDCELLTADGRLAAAPGPRCAIRVLR